MNLAGPEMMKFIIKIIQNEDKLTKIIEVFLKINSDLGPGNTIHSTIYEKIENFRLKRQLRLQFKRQLKVIILS
jgi:hypothetical protein